MRTFVTSSPSNAAGIVSDFERDAERPITLIVWDSPRPSDKGFAFRMTVEQAVEFARALYREARIAGLAEDRAFPGAFKRLHG
jgi:hypothetical protein